MYPRNRRNLWHRSHDRPDLATGCLAIVPHGLHLALCYGELRRVHPIVETGRGVECAPGVFYDVVCEGPVRTDCKISHKGVHCRERVLADLVRADVAIAIVCGARCRTPLMLNSCEVHGICIVLRIVDARVGHVEDRLTIQSNKTGGHVETKCAGDRCSQYRSTNLAEGPLEMLAGLLHFVFVGLQGVPVPKSPDRPAAVQARFPGGDNWIPQSSRALGSDISLSVGPWIATEQRRCSTSIQHFASVFCDAFKLFAFLLDDVNVASCEHVKGFESVVVARTRRERNVQI